jgi:SEL1 protein
MYENGLGVPQVRALSAW